MLWALLFGNFVIGTGVMVVPGTLNDISHSLQIPVAQAGQLVTAGGILMALGAPTLAAVVAGWDRRRVLAWSLVWYAMLHAVCAFTPGFASLMIARVLAMVAPAVFTPQAAACVGLLVPPGQRGRAITFVFLGWSVASVLGMPLAAWVGETLGWRAAFGLVSVLAAVGAAWVWRRMPDGVKPPALSMAAWRETLFCAPLMLCIVVTVLYSAGQFVLFAYFAPYYKARLAVTPLQLSFLFAWFGAFGLLGNWWMSRNIDRLGPARCVQVGIVLMAVSLLLWPLGSSMLLVALITVPWALGGFSTNSAQQARLVGIAPALAAASVALNTSAIYAGQAIGAASGGWLVARDRMDHLHWAGLIGVVCAMLVSFQATHLAKRRGR